MIANVKCKEAFEVQNLVLQPFNGIACENGTWSENLFNCEPECGTLIPKGQALVIKGYTANQGEFPWHAGIYHRLNETVLEQVCGGTLISEKVVISGKIINCLLNFYRKTWLVAQNLSRILISDIFL